MPDMFPGIIEPMRPEPNQIFEGGKSETGDPTTVGGDFAPPPRDPRLVAWEEQGAQLARELAEETVTVDVMVPTAEPPSPSEMAMALREAGGAVTGAFTFRRGSQTVTMDPYHPRAPETLEFLRKTGWEPEPLRR